MNRRLLLSCALGLAALAAPAAHIDESIALTKGWNAVYIESTPDVAEPAALFADAPVQKVACYESSAYADTAQYNSDGSALEQKSVGFYFWQRGEEEASTLRRMTGGHCYFIFATEACTRTWRGVPSLPRVSWQRAETGFTTIAGVSAPAGTELAASAYFGEGPLSSPSAPVPYAVAGVDAAAPVFVALDLFSRKPKVAAGRAYAFEGASAREWPGVLDVRTDLSGGLRFARGASTASVALHNAGTTNRTVRVALEPSAAAEEVQPALAFYREAVVGQADGWEPFATTNLTLAAGESRRLVFACDKSALDFSKTNAAVLSFSDLGPTKMRVRIPVTVEADVLEPGEGAYPQGLWIGRATISQVSHGTNATPVTAAGKLRATILVHVDAAGKPTLLQRVAVAQVPEAEGSSAYRSELYDELAHVPAGVVARRISSVVLDTANRAVPATDEAAFGTACTFAFTIGERSKENPFLHVWHPDHDGRSADYKSAAPSGDVAQNFIGCVKPESFSVRNTLRLVWEDADGRSTFERTPDETTYGRIDWRLEGLRADAPIAMRGVFVLKRLSAAAMIKGE